MAALSINAIAENASRLGARLQESLSEHTRDLNLSRGTSSEFFETNEERLKNIHHQLDSNSDREKLDAMKRLIAMISKGRNVPEFFAQVVKNVASNNLEIRKLVYIYLLRYAEQEPDLALLSINTFQKDLTDPNPLIRAMALRVLSGVKVPMIGSIVVLAIRKCSADPSPYVRKAAALATPKCFSLDPSHQPELVSIVTALLRDRSPLSIGSVAVAFDAICPTRLDLLHPHYRRMCQLLVDLDEWGQIMWLNLLLRYARIMFSKPSSDNTSNDGDLELLLSSSESLLHSRNPAVTLAVTRVVFYLGPDSRIVRVIPALLRLLDNSLEVERTVLPYLFSISCRFPSALSPYYNKFFIRSYDLRVTKLGKLRILRSILNGDNHQVLLKEFTHYAEDSDDTLVESSICAIGHCARVVPECTQQALDAMMTFIQSKHDVIVTNTVLVLKSLVQRQLTNPAGEDSFPTTVISRLAYLIDDIKHPKSRSCAVWLVGQYACLETAKIDALDGIAAWAPDVLRRTCKSFAREDSEVKLQIISLAAKLLVLNPTNITLQLLGRYALTLARYDQDYDVRDRARSIAMLLMGVAPTVLGDEECSKEEYGGVMLRREQVRMVLFEHKAAVKEASALEGTSGFSLATSSLVIGRAMTLAEGLPEWLEQGTESSLRDTEDDMRPPGPAQVPAPRSIASTSRGPTPVILTPTGADSPVTTGSSPAPWTDLDKFYADIDEPTESDDDGGEGSVDGDDGGDTSGTLEDNESTSGEGETASDSEGSTA